MTVEEVRTALGLMPHERWREEQTARNAAWHPRDMADHRRTGRTTEMLLTALAALSNGGRVMVVFWKAEQARRAGKLIQDMARSAGILINGLRVEWGDPEREARSFDGKSTSTTTAEGARDRPTHPTRRRGARARR